MVQRLTLRRRLSYNTNSNRRKVVKTPGGRLVYHYVKKTPTFPKCGDPSCRIKLNGVVPARPREWSRMSRRLKTVNRAYGGSRCATCVRNRVVRAFLIEEQKIVSKVIKAQQQQTATTAAKK
jgi:large subunit ribosomal protein L34e